MHLSKLSLDTVLFIKFSMCGFHVQRESNVKPKNLNDLTYMICELFMNKGGSVHLYFFVNNIAFDLSLLYTTSHCS